MTAAEDVRVVEGPGPASPVLFLDGAFAAFQAQAQHKRLVTFAVGPPDREVWLTLGGALGQWSSPVTGAFGGASARGPAASGDVWALAEAATLWLRRELDAQSATIRLPPDAFGDPCSANLENALVRSGWRLEHVDVNHHLEVTSPEAHFARLGETKRKIRNRLVRSGAAVQEEGLSSAEAVYEVIAQNRAAQGYPMTMTWSQIEALAEAFPDRVRVFAVRRDAQLLAGAISLQVARSWLYVFYWGERPDFRRESPVLLLTHGLMASALAEGVSILDIGVSTDRGTPNPGLAAFKESLGCRASARRTYVLDATR